MIPEAFYEVIIDRAHFIKHTAQLGGFKKVMYDEKLFHSFLD